MLKKNSKIFGVLLGLALPFMLIERVAAYEVVDLKDGGTITGIVTLAGPVPAPKAFNLVTFPDPEYCGRISDGNGWRLLRDFTGDDESGLYGLKDAVVLLEGIEAGNPFAMSVPRVEARG